MTAPAAHLSGQSPHDPVVTVGHKTFDLIEFELGARRLGLLEQQGAKFMPGDGAIFAGGIAVITWALGRFWDWHKERKTAMACFTLRRIVDMEGWISWESYQKLVRLFGTTIAEIAIVRVGVKIRARATAG